MAGKLGRHTQDDDMHLIEAVRQSVERIWQAGLGAFARAQHEGEEMFTRLVQEGMEVQKRTQHLAEDRIEEMTETITRMAENLGKQASAPLGKLETAFEDRVTRSLHSIGVPTRDDIEALSAQIGKLQKAVNALGAKPAKSTRKAAASSDARKTVAARTNGAGRKRSTAAGSRA